MGGEVGEGIKRGDGSRGIEKWKEGKERKRDQD